MRTVLAWVWVLLWMSVIFIASSQPSFVFSSDGWSDFLVKKLAHFTEYAILGYLSIRAFKISSYSISPKILLTVLIFCFFYALSDEIHQSFVPGRQPHLRDVLIDTIGACFGVYVFNKRYKTTG